MVDPHILQHIRIHLDALPHGPYQQISIPGIPAMVLKRHLEHLLFAGEVDAKAHVCGGRLVVLVRGLSPPGRDALAAGQARGLGVAAQPDQKRIAAKLVGMIKTWRQALG